MKIKAAVVVVGVGLLLAGRPVVAHHAFSAEFDAVKPIKLTGAVTRLDWTNPHAWIYTDVKDDTGKVVNWGSSWRVRTASCGQGGRGFRRNPGNVVTVEGPEPRTGPTTRTPKW